MKLFFLNFLLLFLISICTYSQNSISVKANVDTSKNEISISQTIEYFNTSNNELQSIYLNDWNNSFSSKKTPLALRFADEFNTKFYFGKEKDLGFTTINSISQNNQKLNFERLKNQSDILKVELAKALKPGESYTLNLNYIIKIPSDKYTRFGVTEESDFNLRYWYITPTTYNGEWQNYSNKDLDDLFLDKTTITLEIEFPVNYSITSELNKNNSVLKDSTKIVSLSGKNRVNTKLYLTKNKDYKTIETDFFTITSNIESKELEDINKAIITEKIAKYLTENLGDYPHKKLVLSEIDYKRNPVYGLNQLPDIIRPFPNKFQYEIKLIKTALHNYLENTLLINPRKDQWIFDAIETYFLMNYVDEFYPDMKLFGTLAKIWGIRSFHAADLFFNKQYDLGYMQMARTNRDQPLTMRKDSLLKFNKNIANKYKAGLGLRYLDDFINEDILETTVHTFLKQSKLSQSSSKEFEILLKSKTTKDLSWFFNDYLNSTKKIDYTIKDVSSTNDSITFNIENKRNSTMPISLFTLKEDSIISKSWIKNVSDKTTITIAKDSIDKIALNYDQRIPEINQRNNSYKTNSSFFTKKPIQFRLFQDIEDPNYNQIFLMPVVQFNNIYDGLSLGTRFYNKTLLRKPFVYSIAPQYATKSKAITGSVSSFYRQYIENRNLYEIIYGIKFKRQSFAENLFVDNIRPTIEFKFRDKNDYRSNKRQSLQFRYYKIERDEDVDGILEDDEIEPSYSVFNIQYRNSNHNLIHSNNWFTDLQIADKFGKLSFNYSYRKLFDTSRQFNFRFFAGAFLYNNTPTNSDYFSYALDRPTDYLFDYLYLGRTESTGLVSQQLILAEGGFKSKLDTPFANQWITTANVGGSIWRYFQVYGDVGFVKNKGIDPKFVYDSGLRLNLVQDYFEIYFPIYSNLGWEIGKDNYQERIRFIFTVDPQALLGLFRRKWY